jgi:ketosteroid isomerase-like protein
VVTERDPAEVVRRLFAASAAERRDDVLALLHPDVEVTAVADGSRYRGHADVRAYFGGQEQGPTRTEVALQRVEAVGDGEVIARGRIRIHDHRNGLSDSPAAWRIVVRDGLVVRVDPLTPA